MNQTWTQKSLILIGLGWLSFIVSFFLPATDIMEVSGTIPGTPLNGWQAFKASTMYAVNPLLWIVEPGAAAFMVFPFVNGMMLLAPSSCLAFPRRAASFSVVFIPASIVPWLVPESLTGNFFVGFYIWDLSLLIMACGCLGMTAACCSGNTAFS